MYGKKEEKKNTKIWQLMHLKYIERLQTLTEFTWIDKHAGKKSPFNAVISK